jgi:GNAT superfamily N-acetyltransferase
MSEKLESSIEASHSVSLRKATEEDVAFLFKVSTDAMKPVVEELNPDKEVDEDEDFLRYKENFIPEEIEIIQFKGTDAGRLRVVRSVESIYIGGIQILPEFQNKGIGTAIFDSLIEEPDVEHLPILLEVHKVNHNARNFYLKLGFVEGEDQGEKVQMKYEAKT